MNDGYLTLIFLCFMAAGFGMALLWMRNAVRASARMPPEGTTPRLAQDGLRRVIAGAAAGVAMGVVLGCSGIFGLLANFGGDVDLPEETQLFLLLIPVGLILCPGLVMWGTIAAWRVVEADPDFDDRLPDAKAATPAGRPPADDLSALDAPFES
ncbi:MAG: hypothetical protein AAF907_05850 [Planctomycetota bacterium]